MHSLILKLTRKSFQKCYLSAAMLLLCAGSGRAQAQQSSSVPEKNAADTVAALVQQARQQAKLPELSRIEDPRLREDACVRAKRESTSWQVGCGASVSDAAVLSCFSYLTTNPSQPVPELLSWATQHERRNPRRFGVGVCLVHTPQSPQERYWIEVGSYMGATKSVFWHVGWALAHLWSR